MRNLFPEVTNRQNGVAWFGPSLFEVMTDAFFNLIGEKSPNFIGGVMNRFFFSLCYTQSTNRKELI